MMEVYKAIAAVQGELAKVGIGKNNKNEQQNYKFRGIDDVYNALAPLLAKHQLCVIPRVVSCDRSERVSVKTWNGQAKESVLFYVTVHAEFDFVSSADGSKHTAATFGEAMDSGDKATNKAMSAAYKYAAFMTFAIPTEGDNDADATTHEVAPRQNIVDAPVAKKPADAKPREKMEGPIETVAALRAIAGKIRDEIRAAEDTDTLDTYLLTMKAEIDQIKRYQPDWWDNKDYGLDGMIASAYRRIEAEMGDAAEPINYVNAG